MSVTNGNLDFSSCSRFGGNKLVSNYVAHISVSHLSTGQLADIFMTTELALKTEIIDSAIMRLLGKNAENASVFLDSKCQA